MSKHGRPTLPLCKPLLPIATSSTVLMKVGLSFPPAFKAKLSPRDRAVIGLLQAASGVW